MDGDQHVHPQPPPSREFFALALCAFVMRRCFGTAWMLVWEDKQNMLAPYILERAPVYLFLNRQLDLRQSTHISHEAVD